MAKPKKKSDTTTENVIQIAYRYRAYPTDLQEYRIENWLGALCGLYNGAIAVRPDGLKIYVSNYWGGIVSVIQRTTGKKTPT